MVSNLRHLYWDLTAYGPSHPDGIGRFTVALAERAYALPSTYLLPPHLDGGGLQRALSRCPGRVVIAHNHPRRRYPWRWYWEQVLPEPGLIVAPGNWHRPCRWPTLLVIHDLIPFDDPDYAGLQHCSLAAYEKLVRGAAAVLTISGFTAGRIQARFPGLAPPPVLRQGLHPVAGPVAPDWAPKNPFYLFVGGAEPRKRLECAVALAAQFGDAGLVVLGGDWGRRRPVAALTAGWSSRFALTARDGCDDGELTWLYRHCRALLYPTRLEGFGLPALEALRQGRPVVAERLSSLPETLGDFALWHDFSLTTVDVGAALRQRIDDWRASPALAAHLSTFDWEPARARFADTIAAILAKVSR